MVCISVREVGQFREFVFTEPSGALYNALASFQKKNLRKESMCVCVCVYSVMCMCVCVQCDVCGCVSPPDWVHSNVTYFWGSKHTVALTQAISQRPSHDLGWQRYISRSSFNVHYYHRTIWLKAKRILLQQSLYATYAKLERTVVWLAPISSQYSSLLIQSTAKEPSLSTGRSIRSTSGSGGEGNSLRENKGERVSDYQ